MLFDNLYNTSKKIILTRLICFFWLTAKVISWKVWLAYRLFPMVPLFDFLFAPQIVHLLLFIVSLSGIAALLIFPSKKFLQVSVIVIELLSCALDQNRWQSWEYEYIFVILALVINSRKDKNALSSIAFIFVSVYFYSGLAKLNAGFSGYLQRELISFGILHPHDSYLYNLLLYHIGYLMGMIEILLSIGLIFKQTRKAAAVLLTFMHLCILAFFGPFGINYNVIIWPWNSAMLLAIYLFFICDNPVTITLPCLTYGWNKIFILLFGLLPFLNFFGYWDYFLSSSLFSYRPPEMYVCINEKGSSKNLDRFTNKKQKNFICDSNSSLLNIRSWSLQEMNVPAYPEIRVYKKIKKELLSRYPVMKATFIVYRVVDGTKKRMDLK